ncbi:MAG: hypothetical protein PHV20_01380 [Bacteroidales bacterium]|nr:hypothetical protein [Bacteroidales bacterium]
MVGSLTGTAFVDNFEYDRSRDSQDPNFIDLDKVYNAEGYLHPSSPVSMYYYYRKDHTGDNREVWYANTNTTVQKTQYYASGLPWTEGTGASVQNKKYNGKEFIEMHGYDTYDIVWRQYYPAIGRFQTPDPEVENDYDLSPYSMCGNNTVLNTDPDGRVFGIDNAFGAFAGGVVDYGEQVAANYATGSESPWTNNINLVSIGTAVVVGGLTSGASAVESVVAKTLIKVGATAISNTVKVTTSKEGLKTEFQTNPINVIKNTAIDLTVNKAAGKLSSKLVGNPLSKVGTTNAGRLTSGMKTVVKSTGNNITRKVTENVKRVVKTVAKGAAKTTESSTKALMNKKQEEVKKGTNL